MVIDMTYSDRSLLNVDIFTTSLKIYDKAFEQIKKPCSDHLNFGFEYHTTASRKMTAAERIIADCRDGYKYKAGEFKSPFGNTSRAVVFPKLQLSDATIAAMKAVLAEPS